MRALLERRGRELAWRDAKIDEIMFELVQPKRLKFERTSVHQNAEQRALRKGRSDDSSSWRPPEEVSMKGFETLLLSKSDGVATITLNRPAARNALSREMARELRVALERVQADPAVRALIVHGAGGAFCAGGDLRASASAGTRTAEDVEAAFEPFRSLTLALHAFDRPVIAAAEGVAYGAGFSLLLLCDIVLLADTARLCMAFQRIGAVPDCGAMYTLPRVVGLQRAKELMLSAREVGAEEALRLGLCLEVLAPAGLLPRAQAMARTFCDASPCAVRLTKRGLAASGASLDDVLSYEAIAQAVSFTSSYLKNAASRYVNKTPPLFKWP